MAVTLRQMLVKTLINIGDPVVANNVPTAGNAITDDFQLQVCNFINHIKEEVEAAHNWSSRWQTFTFTFAANQNNQHIVDVGGYLLPAGAYPYSGATTVKMREPRMGREVALCFDISDTTIPFPLEEVDAGTLRYLNSVTNNSPVQYGTAFNIQDQGNDNVYMWTFPVASQARTVQITMYNPQQYLDPTNGSGTQTDIWDGGTGGLGADSPIIVPARLVELGAAWWCLQERGESLGTNSMFSEDRYRTAMDDLINKDQANQGDLVLVPS